MKGRISGLASFSATVKWCLALSWKTSIFYTLVRIAADIVTPLLAIFAAFVGKYLIDLISGSWQVDRAERVLAVFIAVLFAIALVRMVGAKATQYAQAMQSEKINAFISMDMMNRSLSADLEFFDNPDYYDRLRSATQDSMSVSYILWNVLSCMSAAVSFVGAFVILLGANPLYGIIMMAAAIPASIAAAKYTKLLYMLSLEQINENRQLGYVQFLSSERAYAQDVRLFNAGARLKERYRRIWDALFIKRKTVTRKRSILSALLECMPEGVVVGIGAHIAYRALSGYATVGDYVLFTGLAAQLWGAMHMFSSSALQIYDNKLKIENIKKLDTFENKIQDTGTLHLTKVESIAFENVTFIYPGTTKPAVQDVTFHLANKEKTVLVGVNGSGKSTLIKLLLRMYNPNEGRILINGHDIKEYKLEALRANFSVYFQEMHNYSFSLRENFTIADKSGTDQHAEEMLQAAHGQDILNKAAAGMDTPLTRHFDPSGLELSGGQHQKISLARALFRTHTMLILDEPSSNLDPKAEHEVFQSLVTLTQDKLTLFTSHRLSNIALANKIIVMENGRIIEAGTQAELLANKHRFAELFAYQKEKFETTK